jgi:hypothetical protein
MTQSIISLPFSGGSLPEKLLRNRGRLRQALSSHHVSNLRKTLILFLKDEWCPPLGPSISSYRISLTSYLPRLPLLPLTLLTLIQQTLRPKEIVVWMAKNDTEALDVGLRQRFGEMGVRFQPCQDFGPHTKWLPMIEEGQLDPFVFCDDDTIYPREWFASLVAEDRADAYVGTKCHQITFSPTGQVAPYSDWRKQIRTKGQPSHDIFITGCGGAIIHPKRLSTKFTDRHVIRRECPKADDIWLKSAHLAAGIPCHKTLYSHPCLDMPGSMDSRVMSGVNQELVQKLDKYFQMLSNPVKSSSPQPPSVA